MITTYLIESPDKHVVQYFRKLYEAKNVLLAINNPEYRILCMKGQYFGEGFHRYQIVCHKGSYPGAVFLKTKLR